MSSIRTIQRISTALVVAIALPLAAQANPTAISACTTITTPGSYLLTTNLYANGDCIVVDAPFVSIDLDGYLIQGDGPGSGVVADYGAGRGGLEIRNGTIADFGAGFGVDGRLVYGGVIVEKLRLTGNKYGAALGARSTARENHIRGTRNGLDMGDYATAHGNDVSDFIGVGISVGAGSRITDNDVARKLGERAKRPPDPNNASTTFDGTPDEERAEIPEIPEAQLPDMTVEGDPADPVLAPTGPPVFEDASPKADPYVPQPPPPHQLTLLDGYGINAGEGSTVMRNTVFDAHSVGIRAAAGSTVSHNTTRNHFNGIWVDCPSSMVGNTSTQNGFIDIFPQGPTNTCVDSQNATP